MKNNTKKYWKGIEELNKDPEFLGNADKEFSEPLPASFYSLPAGRQVNDANGENPTLSSNRRDFLKMVGFSVAAASLVACEIPIKKAIPYLNKPEEIDPGVANWYASSYMDGGDYCSVLVKTREGRPIKIEGNKLSGVTMGGLNARAQASVLSLYDNGRIKGPGKIENGKNKHISWEDADKNIISKLERIAENNGQIRIISSTLISPATKKVIDEFIAKYPTAKHITYDANSSSAILYANKATFDKFIIPSYDFSKANVIVSIGADFLGTWISPVEYARQYSKTRKIGKSKKQMSRHYQFESVLSLTGANADHRSAIKPSQQGLVVAALYNELAELAGRETINTEPVKNVKFIDKAATDLWANKGRSLVVCGSNDVSVQILVNKINQLLINYGNAVEIDVPSFQKQGDDAAMGSFIENVRKGNISAVIFYNANPVYDHPSGSDLKDALKKVGLKVSFADRVDETASQCDYICPDHHYLEAWNDAEPKKGYFSLGQPTISPIFKTRAAQESLLTWANIQKDYYGYLKESWKSNLFPLQTKYASFQKFWDKSLHNGVFELAPSVNYTSIHERFSVGNGHARSLQIRDLASKINKNYKANSKETELVLYEKIGIGTGSQANNPWLQELPDPISKACWDNYLAISPKYAKDQGLTQDDYVKIEAGDNSAVLPVLIQPGQVYGTVAIAIGYGRKKAGKCANGIGKNVYPFASITDGALNFSTGNVKITKTEKPQDENHKDLHLNTRITMIGRGDRGNIAQTQTHDTIMARDAIVQEATFEEYLKDPKAGRYFPKVHTHEGPKDPKEVSLWPKGHEEHEHPNHHWGMVIDMNSCIGCSACLIGCQAENNVPVVGKEEVLNRREMHWIRIDRYYSSDANKKDLKGLEIPSEDPEVTFQPMMCQHCNRAPCETVCPVLATTHSTEGLNQMVYNRCIGTRFCANNCPYKVRRFNWFKYPENDQFDYHMNNELGKMVLNPDVTVRSRGVMEKCTMCVQRIQEGKLKAKKEKRRPIDGEFTTACARSCPTEAIVFGDMNDPESKISKTLKEENKDRAYHVLEELNTQPNVTYLTKIRNKGN
ncbi:MAG: TAT-variant-translocated molybdopterin oxidoreductase [Bacteroidetes bacterium]|nr:TAT-variant-translocated molybdopterin oxidoreductase [Bacteroidota bacterium]